MSMILMMNLNGTSCSCSGRFGLRIEQLKNAHGPVVKGCVTLWAIRMILSSDHKENEFLSTPPLHRWKASGFIKDECGGILSFQ
jgi:hypothetical protein